MDPSFWNGATVLVTGGSGFIGRWIARSLDNAGVRLQILDVQPPKHLDVPHDYSGVNLGDLDKTCTLLNGWRPDVILHLAGQSGVGASHRDPLGAFASNVIGTLHLLEACRRVPAPRAIVVVSSNHVYGEQHTKPSPETAPLNAVGMYSVTKLCGDVLARAYGKGYSLPIGIARMTNSFGGDDHHTTHIVTGSILAAIRGERPVITGNGRDTKGFMYVKDTVDGLLSVAEGVAHDRSLHGEAFNLAPERAVSVLELVQEVLRVVGLDAEPVIQGAESGHETEHLDISKAHDVLGWRPRYSLQEGLRETVAWYRERDQEGRDRSDPERV